MSLPRLDYPTRIADRLNELAALVKTRSRGNLTDANQVLEAIFKRFFNALYGWDLINLNMLQVNYPAADLGDTKRRIAIQVTNEDGSDKITQTADKAIQHKLSEHFDKVIIFFLLPKKPKFPKRFAQPPHGPRIETKDLGDLVKEMKDNNDLDSLARAANVLDQEMGRPFVVLSAAAITHKGQVKSQLEAIVRFAIPRALLTHEDSALSKGWSSLAKASKLIQLVREKRLIAVLSDAGYGKSIELKSLAVQLSENDSELVPIFSTLNKYVNHSIQEYIPETTQFPDEALVLILDGFDEVQAEHKIEAVRQIEFFAERHPLCRIVLSSRTNQYQQVEGFERFYLTALRSADIDKYLDERLGRKGKRFKEQVWKKNFHDLTTHPFYLNLMVETFAKSGSLPQRRADLFEFFVQSQLEEDLKKFRKVTPDIEGKRLQISASIERLALIMETLGRNFVIEHELNAIIPDQTERDLTTALGLLKKVEGEKVAVQFQHNNFQEFLAAKVLAHKPLLIIKEFVAFPTDYLQTKPSWANTISFIMSLTAEDSVKFSEIVNWLSQIEPEVLFKGEPDRISPEMRFVIFETMFEEFRKKRIRIGRETYSVKDIGQFADSQRSVEYLVSVLETESDATILGNAIDILRFMNIPPSLRIRVERLLMAACATDSSEQHLVASVLLTLADLGFDSRPTSSEITAKLRDSDSTWIRFALYYYLYNSEHLDENVDVFLEGIKYLRDSRSAVWGNEEPETRLGDETWHLAEGLKRIRDPQALKKVLKYFAENPKSLDTVIRDDGNIQFIDNLVAAYNEDHDIFHACVELFGALISEYQEEQLQPLLRFFDETGTRRDLFELLFSKRSVDKEWYGGVATVLNEALAERIAEEYLKDGLTEHDVWVVRNFIPWRSKNNSEWYLDVINRRTNNKFQPRPPRDYDAERKARFDRDIQLLFDRDAFLGEARRIYDTEKKDRLTKHELREVQVKHFENPCFSDLVLRDLEHFTENTPHTFDEYKEVVLDCSWEDYRGRKLYGFMSNNKEMVLSPEQTSLLKQWCLDNLHRVNFRTALVSTGKGTASTSHLASILWFFVRKLDIDCPKNVLLDLISFDWIAEHQMAGIQYLEDRLEVHEMTERVLENLTAGIKVDDVLKNHLDYCRRYAIREIIPFAINVFGDQQIADNARLAAMDALLVFEEGVNALVDLLPSITDELRWSALDKIRDIQPTSCLSIAKQIMKKTIGQEEERLRAARVLIGLQDLDGLKYFVTKVKETNSAILAYPEEATLRNIVGRDALPLLIQLLEATYERGFQDNKHYSIHNNIQGALTRIAIANDCFNEVKSRLLDLIERKRSDNDDVRFLHAFIMRLERDVRLNKSTHASLSDAITQVDRILS
jgi:hypothetical protein